MGVLSRDTSIEMERIQLAILRKIPVWRKLELISEMGDAAREVFMAGLRKRHPEATDAQLLRMYAEKVLGSELAEKVYGPIELRDI